MIDSKVFKFLNDIKSNNNREWFNTNKQRYKWSLEQIKNSIVKLVELMNSHDKIENYKIFRIYRDVRFSKNKTPYKNNFGISLVREKPKLRGGYYFHIEPSNSFSAVGFWQPEKDDLFRIRKEIELDGKEFSDVISSKLITKKWGNLVGESLKTFPRGFSKVSKRISSASVSVSLARVSKNLKTLETNTALKTNELIIIISEITTFPIEIPRKS